MKILVSGVLGIFVCVGCSDVFRPATYPAGLDSLPEFVAPSESAFGASNFRNISGTRIRDDGYEVGIAHVEILEQTSSRFVREMMATPTSVAKNSDEFFWTKMEGWVGAFSKLPQNDFSEEDEVYRWENVNGSAFSIASKNSGNVIFIWNSRYQN